MLKAGKNLFTSTPKRFWPSFKLKCNLCTSTPIFCHVKNLNKIVYLHLKFFGAKLKAKGKFVYLNAKSFFG